MSKFLSDADVFGAPVAKKEATQTPKPLSDEEVFGTKKPKVDAIDADASSVVNRVGNSLKTGVNSMVSNVSGLADMVLGIPGQALGIGAEQGARLVGAATGETRKQSAQSGAAIKHKLAEHPLNILSSPTKKLMHALGYKPGYDESDVAKAMETFSSWLDKGGEWVEQKTKGIILKEDFAALADQAMLGGGVHGVSATVKAVQKRPDLGTGNRAGYDAAAQREAAFREKQAASAAEAQAKQDAWAEKYSTKEGAETARAESQAKWAQQYKPPVVDERFPAARVEKSRMTEGQVMGEAPPTITAALEKVRAGQGFDLTAAEKVALRGLETSESPLVLPERFRDAKGAANPRLLAGLSAIGLGTILGQYFDPEEGAGMMIPFLGAGAVKGKGGMWHPDAVERLAAPLAERLKQGNYGAVLTDDAPALAEQFKPVQAKVDGMIRNYLNKHAGTATDPLKDVEVPLGMSTARWEALTDAAIAGETVKGPKGPEKQWGLAAGAMPGATMRKAMEGYLSHVGDYLLENVSPDKLAQYDLVRAVKETQKWDAEKAKKMNSVEGRMEGTTPFKEYPDGFKWVEVKSPDALKREGDVMGHCVGGYCDYVENGDAKIYSLRDAKGQSHVTIELQPTRDPVFNALPSELQLELHERAHKLHPEIKGGGWPIGNEAYVATMEKLLKEPRYQEALKGAAAEDIVQIKGKQNRAPSSDYLPYVQDFVKSGKWGEVGDLENSGLVRKDDIAGKAAPVYSKMQELLGDNLYVTPEEIAKAEIEARKQLPFYAALDEKLRGQRGSIDPELLKIIGIASVGAGVGTAFGAMAGSEKPIRDAVLGGLAGGMLRAPGAREVIGEAIKTADEFGGLISTRIKNYSPELHHRLIQHEKNVLQKTHQGIADGDAFFVALNKAKNPELDRAILTNDPARIRELVADNPELKKGWGKVQEVLIDLGLQLQKAGRLKSLKEGYFPRIVKDKEGLFAALGKDVSGPLEQKLFEAAKTARRDLTQMEESKIIDDYLKTPGRIGGQAGFTKGRKIGEVTEELQPFYATPTESFHSYVRSATSDIEKAKLFGKNLVEVEKNGQKYINLEDSIGEVIASERAKGKLTGPQLQELTDMLRARFGPGEQGAPGVFQDIRNIANAGLLGNFVSAATQMGDTAFQAVAQDLRSAIRGGAAAAGIKRKVDMKDFGLADHISEEFVSTRKSAKALNTMFKYSLFQGIDRFGKNANLNAALARYERLAQSEKGQAEITRKYGESFGEDLTKLVDELKAGKGGEQVDTLLFHELSRSQPVTKLEVPQKYLENPRGRIAYMLKTYMLKQVDFARREGYNEIAKGNVARGVANLTKLGLVLGVAGATTDMVKDYLLGRKVDFEATDIPMNALKTFGWSEYTMDKARQGKPVEAVSNVVAPPFQMFDEIVRADPKAIRYIPLVGKMLYERTEHGEKAQAKRERREELKRNPQLKEERLNSLDKIDSVDHRDMVFSDTPGHGITNVRELAEERIRRKLEQDPKYERAMRESEFVRERMRKVFKKSWQKNSEGTIDTAQNLRSQAAEAQRRAKRKFYI